MKWFDTWFKYQVNKALKDDDRPCPTTNGAVSPCVVRENENVMDYRKSISLKMQNARGGTIVEVAHYDTNTDEWERDLFIVTDEQDLGSEISGIMTQYRLTHL